MPITKTANPPSFVLSQPVIGKTAELEKAIVVILTQIAGKYGRTFPQGSIAVCAHRLANLCGTPIIKSKEINARLNTARKSIAGLAKIKPPSNHSELADYYLRRGLSHMEAAIQAANIPTHANGAKVKFRLQSIWKTVYYLLHIELSAQYAATLYRRIWRHEIEGDIDEDPKDRTISNILNIPARKRLKEQVMRERESEDEVARLRANASRNSGMPAVPALSTEAAIRQVRQVFDEMEDREAAGILRLETDRILLEFDIE